MLFRRRARFVTKPLAQASRGFPPAVPGRGWSTSSTGCAGRQRLPGDTVDAVVDELIAPAAHPSKVVEGNFAGARGHASWRRSCARR